MICLGANICIMAWPAVLCGLLFRPFLAGRKRPSREKSGRRNAAAFACGALAVCFSALLCALALALSGEAFFTVAWTILLAHLPVMVIEGLLTAFIVAFLDKALPELLSPDSPPDPTPGAPARGDGHVL